MQAVNGEHCSQYGQLKAKEISESRPFVKCVLRRERERDTLHDGDMHKDWVKNIARHIACNVQL